MQGDAPTRRDYHILNLGAGVQSTTLYLMYLQGKIEPQIHAAIFADTQDEPSEVYEHLEWLESLGGPTIIRTTAGKLSDALINGVGSTGQRFISIPAFTAPAFTATEGSTKVGRLRRQCSMEFKIAPINKAIRQQVLGLRPGQHVPSGVHVHQVFGISLDEAGRAARIRRAPRPKYRSVHFPLAESLFMSRSACLAWLVEYGNVPHPVPRSACVYCPFHDDAEWKRIASKPEQWAAAVRVDEALRSDAVTSNRNRKNTQLMYLHRSLKPLVQISFDNSDVKPKQSWLGFSTECLGVCGV